MYSVDNGVILKMVLNSSYTSSKVL